MVHSVCSQRAAKLLLALALVLGPGCEHRALVSGQDGGALPQDATGHADSTGTDPDSRAPDPCTYKLTGGPTTLSSSDVQAYTPSAAYTGKHFGVIWMRSSTTVHPVIRMRLASNLAAPLGPETTVGPESHSWAELAHDGTQFGLCWHTDPGMKGRVGFRRITNAGLPSAGTVDVGTGQYSGICGDLIATAEGWAAVVQGTFEAKGGSYANRYGLVLLDQSGKPGGAVEELVGFAEESTRVSLVLAGKTHFAAYRKGLAKVLGDVMVQPFDKSGRRSGQAQLVTPGPEHATSPVLVWTGSGLAVVYIQTEETHHDTRVLVLQALSASGSPAGSPVRLTNTERATAHSAVWSGAELAVLWASTKTDVTPTGPQRLLLARLRPDGKRLQPDLQVSEGPAGEQVFTYTSVVGSPEILGLAWQERTGGTETVRFAAAGCPSPYTQTH